MSNMSNMSLWNNVCKSDSKSIKEVKFGRKFSAISAQFQFKSATEQFGIFGYGWGLRNEVWDFESIPKVLVYRADLFYFFGDGDEGVVPIASSINMYDKNNKYDEECLKKVSTDSLTKGLSRLGFNSDVFEGMWDDNKYVAQLKMDEAVDAQQEKMDAAANKTIATTTEKAPGVFLLDKLTEAKIGNMKGFALAFNITNQDKTVLKSYIDKKIIDDLIVFYKAVVGDGVEDVKDLVTKLKFTPESIVKMAKSYTKAKTKKGTDLVEAVELYKSMG